MYWLKLNPPPWNHQKPYGFLMISGEVEVNCLELPKRNLALISKEDEVKALCSLLCND